jgi:Domain of Unknown Function (DUF928)
MLKKMTMTLIFSSLASVSILSSLALAQLKIVYNPPSPQEPRTEETNSGATRGCQKDLAGIVTLLAPTNHVGLTVSSRPTLFFNLSRKSPVPVLLTLAAIDERKAIVEQRLFLDSPGLKSFSLPPEVELEVGKKYVWTITLVCNWVRVSENLDVQQFLKRVTVSQKLKQELAQVQESNTRERSRLYATNGIWYDALANLLKDRSSKTATRDLQNLIKQVGIDENLLYEQEKEK